MFVFSYLELAKFISLGNINIFPLCQEGYFPGLVACMAPSTSQTAEILGSSGFKGFFVCLCHFVYLFVFRRQFFLLIFLEPEYLAECSQWGCSGCRGGLVFLAVGSEALPGNLGVPGSIWKSLYSWHSSGLIPCPSSSRRHYSIRRWALKLATLDLHLGSTSEWCTFSDLVLLLCKMGMLTVPLS